jgi:cell division septation protein DedD
MARVGTWNLENLFRPAPGASQETKDGYDAKLDALASLIRDMAPDVLAVQEVGKPEVLQDLADVAVGAWHTATADPDGRGIRVGFLSRLELTDVVEVAALPDKLRPIQVDDTTATSTDPDPPPSPTTPTQRSASPAPTTDPSCSPSTRNDRAIRTAAPSRESRAAAWADEPLRGRGG